MKILKALLVILIPAFALVSCEKSQIKPSCSHEATTPATDNSASDAGKTQTGSKGNKGITTEDAGNDGNGSTSIVGSGDDDRDGGDKKKKIFR